MLARGGNLEAIFAELMGRKTGATGGKGGSMHFYNKAANFFGGQGIVGAQVPVGTGLAFANKYQTPPGEKMPVAVACYGDGAANQGQIAEAANMSMLWKLPMLFAIENNQYGMGTSSARSSSNTDYYTMGNIIPGLRIYGQDVLAVRDGVKFAREYAAAGNGPMFLEFSTYRFNGHSMSDPGTVYRERSEIKYMRDYEDPLGLLKARLINHLGTDPVDIKHLEDQVRAEVDAACDRARASTDPDPDDLVTNIYMKEQPSFIRMPAIQDSIVSSS